MKSRSRLRNPQMGNAFYKIFHLSLHELGGFGPVTNAVIDRDGGFHPPAGEIGRYSLAGNVIEFVLNMFII
jgi:hypothetical protein